MLRGMKFVCLAWLSAIMTHNAFCSSGFTIIPESVVVAIGEKATFYCQALQARYVDWKINGKYLGQDPPVDITPGTERDRNDSLVSTLTIQGRPDLNQTQVECEATSWDGSMETSSPVTLTISDDTVERAVRRGESVRLECYRENSTIGWTVNGIIVGGYSFRGLTLETASESFNESRLHTLTLIVKGNYNDVIINITCFTSLNQRRRLIKLYKVVVQESSTVWDGLPSTSVSLNGHNASQRSVQIFINEIGVGAEADSKSYSLRLQSLDATQQGNVPSRVLSLTKSAFNESFITFNSILLNKNGLWKATIIVSGCCQSFNYFEISTHSFQNVSVTSPQPGEVRVTGDFINGSTATGLLTIVISTSEIFYHLIERGSDQLLAYRGFYSRCSWW